MNKIDHIKERHYYPMLVSYKAGIKDSEEVFLQKWDELDSLEESKKDFLTSERLISYIKNVCKDFNLEEGRAAEFTRIIRDIFFGKISRGNITEAILSRINSIDSGKAQVIASIVINKILNAVPGEELKKPRNVVRLSLSQAMKEYPKLESQQITNDFLKLRYSEFPSRPTIKNWITDYYQNLGVGGHGIMERGNFLFHSDNCKKLTSVERQKLALVFKSLSENMPLVIDTERQQIVFPEISNEQRAIISKEQESINNAQRTEQNPKSNPPAGGPNPNNQNTVQNTNSSKGEIRFFSGQEMKPSPPVSQNVRQDTITKIQDTNFEVEKKIDNADNLRFSSPQKLPAERNKQEAQDSTLKIYPRGYRNGSENNDNANTQDVKISGNIVDLRNKD